MRIYTKSWTRGEKLVIIKVAASQKLAVRKVTTRKWLGGRLQAMIALLFSSFLSFDDRVVCL